MMGDLEAGRAITYVGRIIPIVHASEDGKDGHVHIEFYAKPRRIPSVELAWTDSKGKRHELKRNLWVLQRRDAAAINSGSGESGHAGIHKVSPGFSPPISKRTNTTSG